MAIEQDRRTVGRRRVAASGALFLVLAIALTWPLAQHLGTATPSRHRDARITAWLLAWDAHALRTDPADLFHAPIFHPEPDTLAYSEHMVGLAVFAAPVTWLTGNLYAGQNVVYIASIAFAAFAAMLLAFELTGNYPAALVAATAFGFAPYWSNQEMHLQILACGWIPMALFGLVRWYRTERARFLALATTAGVIASLTSWYQAAFVVIALVVTGAVLFVARRPERITRMARQGLFAAVVAGAVVWPFSVPYQRVHDRTGFTRSLSDTALLSARPASYLAAPPSNLLYGRLTSRWSGYPKSVELNLFPGIGVAALAAVGLVARDRSRDEKGAVVAFALLSVIGVILAFGAGPLGIRRHLPWAFLQDHVELFGGLRAAARAHVLTVLGLAMLAAFGARQLIDRTRSRGKVIAGLLIALVISEGAAVPLGLGPDPRAEHAELASRPGAVLELPIGRPHDADVMLRGTAHWRPLANGISGYTPDSYKVLLHALEQSPVDDVLSLLRGRGIRTVILNLRLLGSEAGAMQERFRGRSGVREISRGSGFIIYDLSVGAS